MDNISYKIALKQMIIDFGVAQSEIQYWDFLISRLTEQQAQTMVDILKDCPELFLDLHHNLIKKTLFLQNKGTDAEWLEILQEEKQVLKKILGV
jgi:hypothetical protein